MPKFTYIILVIFTIIGCNSTQTIENRHTVTVSIIPQKFFVNKIAGNWLSVNVMIPPGSSPATYDPTPQQMKSLSKSQAYFRIGHISFEKSWMSKLTSINSNMKVIDTSEGVELITEENFEDKHSNHKGHNHTHTGYNPHIWLSPDLVKKQANNIFHALKELYPEHEQTMKINFDKFLLQCDSVKIELDKQLKNSDGTGFIVYHPVWSYMARDYNLHEIAIEHNEKEPTANRIKQIIDFANESNIRVVFVQKEFSNTQAKTIANEINGKVIILNPLNYNWFNTMKEFAEVFSAIHNKKY